MVILKVLRFIYRLFEILRNVSLSLGLYLQTFRKTGRRSVVWNIGGVWASHACGGPVEHHKIIHKCLMGLSGAQGQELLIRVTCGEIKNIL